MFHMTSRTSNRGLHIRPRKTNWIFPIDWHILRRDVDWRHFSRVYSSNWLTAHRCDVICRRAASKKRPFRRCNSASVTSRHVMLARERKIETDHSVNHEINWQNMRLQQCIPSYFGFAIYLDKTSHKKAWMQSPIACLYFLVCMIVLFVSLI